MSQNIECPVNHITINENRARITAAFVFIGVLSYVLVPSWVIASWVVPVVLMIDFFVRGFGGGRYSPLNIVSGLLVRVLKVKNKPTDQAPKVFAAQLGFLFADILLLADLFDFTILSYTIASLLLVFSFLESALAVCVGCHFYTLIKRIFPATSL